MVTVGRHVRRQRSMCRASTSRLCAKTVWEPLLRYGQTTIQDKVLYGTGSFLLGRAPAELVAEFRQLPIDPAVMQKWLYGNAARVLAMD